MPRGFLGQYRYEFALAAVVALGALGGQAWAESARGLPNPEGVTYASTHRVTPQLTPSMDNSAARQEIELRPLMAAAPQGQSVTLLAEPRDLINVQSVRIIGTEGIPAERLVVPGQGAWEVSENGGEIRFIPESGFSGSPSVIEYVAVDRWGQTLLPATVHISYPDVWPVIRSTPQGRPFTISLPLGRHVDPASVRIGPAEGTPTLTSFTVAGEGTWSVGGPAWIRFTPTPGFVAAPSPISYLAANPVGDPARPELIQITTPILFDVTRAVLRPQPLMIRPSLAPGMDPASVSLVDAAGRSVDHVTTEQGRWQVSGAGLRFTPDPAYRGAPIPVRYTAADVDGNAALPARATVLVAAQLPGGAFLL